MWKSQEGMAVEYLIDSNIVSYFPGGFAPNCRAFEKIDRGGKMTNIFL